MYFIRNLIKPYTPIDFKYSKIVLRYNKAYVGKFFKVHLTYLYSMEYSEINIRHRNG